MDPSELAKWVIRKHDDDPDEAVFDGMDDEDILRMFYQLAKAYLAAQKRLAECHDLLRRVRSFVENGTQFGYIDQLKPGTPEHKTAADVGWMVCQLQADQLPAARLLGEAEVPN